MATISTCIIVKNEKDNIRNCLNSVLLFSDEIIVYDTGSDDGTQDICREYEKVKLVQGEWHDDFAWARNQSFKYATCDYIFWIDADDTISEVYQIWLTTLKNNKIFEGKSLDDILVWQFGYFYQNNKSLLIFSPRLVKRSLNPIWVHRIHETLTMNCDDNSQIIYVNTDTFSIQHNYKEEKLRGLRNIRIYENMELNHEKMDGHDCFQYAKELCNFKNFGKAKDLFLEALTKQILPQVRLLCHKYLSAIYSQEKNLQESLNHLYLAAAVYDKPRADVCCDIAATYKFINKNWEMAVWWFSLAINNIPKQEESIMCFKEHYTTIPCLGICEAAYQLGDYELSKQYNEMALMFDPTNEIALKNKRDYFN